MASIPNVRFRFLLPAALLALACALLISSLARAQTSPRLTVQEVLATGDPAPDFPSGAVIGAIADVPRIDADGNVSSIVFVRDPVEGTPQVLYRTLAGSSDRVFRSGDPAPGMAGTFVQFPNLPQTPRVHGGRLTFAAQVEEGAGSRTGIWSDRAGIFEPLVLTGDSLPRLPADSGVSSFEFTTRGGTVLLRAGFSSNGTSQSGDLGLWRNRTGAWEALVVKGMAAPGLTGAAFGPDPTGVYGPVFAVDARSDGRIIVQGWVTGTRIDQNNDEGLWLETDGGLRLLVREGDRITAKGKATFGPTFSSPTFGGDNENLPPAVNDSGAAIFGAVLRSGKTRLNSVWTTRSGSPALLVRGAVPLSGFGQGDQAPGFPAGTSFAFFTQGAINERNQIAFAGAADEFGDPVRLTEAIWWDVPGSLSLAAAVGRPAPGLPGVTYADLTFETLTDGGALFFVARLAGTGITAANDRALFRAHPDAGVAPVLREGDTVRILDAAGGTTDRVVRSFQFGRDFDQTGRGVVQLSFTDGSAGVYTTAESLLTP